MKWRHSMNSSHKVKKYSTKLAFTQQKACRDITPRINIMFIMSFRVYVENGWGTAVLSDTLLWNWHTENWLWKQRTGEHIKDTCEIPLVGCD